MQHLTIDLGRVYNLTGVATQGKANTNEYVSGYYLLISDGGDFWRMAYSDSEGYEQAFTLLLTLSMISIPSFQSLPCLYLCSHQPSTHRYLCPKLFEGNSDGNSVKVNHFDPPIIAQYIRINPTRWRDRISMRVQLYGCDYRKPCVH